jgi:S1-C subfamily serine protease
VERHLSERRRASILLTSVGAIVAAGVVAGLALASGRTHQAAQSPAAATLALQTTFENVVTRVSPSVVQIETSGGLGSGIVFDAQGHIVTNAHVVGDASRFTVTFPNGRRAQATLVGKFEPDDLAVIHVSGGSVKPASFATAKVRRGQIVLAIGNPLGFRSSVTEGIVSAVRQNIPEGSGVVLPSVIQTSAAINPGNSGGALVDLSGRVVGIPTLAAADPELGGAAAGIGFAIPSTLVTDIAGQIVKNGHVVNSHRAYLGVSIGDTMGASGVVIGKVVANGPAAKAGIQVGDVITSVAGRKTPTADDLATVLAGLRPGQAVKVGISRQNGSTTTVSITLGTYPGSG